MRAVADFLPFVLPYVPGCTDPMAEQAVVTAAIEFCARSCIVQVTDWDNAIEDQPDYTIAVPSMQSLSRVLAVFYNAERLKARSREMVRHAVAARGETVNGVTIGSGTPLEWFCRDPAEPEISLYPPPAESAEGAITTIAAFQPTRGATRLADVLYDDYADDIGAGAVARLLITPAQPFTNPTLATPYRVQFRNAMSAASTLARVGYGAAASRVQFQPFA